MYSIRIKLEMYKFHYGFMKDNARIFKLLYCDTDSFIYEIGENFDEIMHKELFDLSNQPKDSKYYCNDNKKVPGNKLVTYTSNKKSISCFDDKCYILFDGINTLPYGHKDILNIK